MTNKQLTRNREVGRALQNAAKETGPLDPRNLGNRVLLRNIVEFHLKESGFRIVRAPRETN